MKMQKLFHLCLALPLLAVAAQAQLNTPDNIRLAQVVKEGRQVFAKEGAGLTLQETVAVANKDVVIPNPHMVNVMPVPPRPDNADKREEPALRRAMKGSDLVVVAKVVRDMSVETSNHKFIFTASQLTITETLKSRVAELTETPYVIWEGGRLPVDGHHVTMTFSDAKPLLVGHEYLLLLRQTQTPGVFTLDGVNSFDLSSPTVEAVRPNYTRVSPEFKHTRESVIDTFKFNIERTGGKQ